MRKTSKTIFLDFDETLFDHMTLMSWIDSMLSNMGVHAPGELIDSANNHHDNISTTLRLYRHREHYEKITGFEWSYISALIQEKIRSRGHDFCYNDSHDFIQYCVNKYTDVRLLTFGSGEYQLFKIATCPLLRSMYLPTHVVDKPKGEFIRRYFPATNSALIDDKYPLELPDNTQHIHIDRKKSYQTTTKPIQGNVIRAQSLSSVITLNIL